MQARRSHNRGERGFVMVVVIMIIALLASTMAITLKQANTGLREANETKSSDITYGALSRGLSSGIGYIEQSDPFALVDAANQFDIFSSPIGANTVLPLGFGTVAPLPPPAYQVPVQVGLRPGQRTEPPPGEDVRNTYGYVVEVLLEADLGGIGVATAQERATAGVRIPVMISHAN